MNRVEKLRELCRFVQEIIFEETGGNEELAIQTLDRRRKTESIVRLRERILRRLRSEIWERHIYGSSEWEVVHSNTRPSPSWKPLGYIQIATVLGGDHSGWVRRAQAIGIADRNNRVERLDHAGDTI